MCRTSARVLWMLGVSAAVLFVAGSGHAASLGGFSCITNNDSGNCAIGEAQISADLTNNVLTITMSGTDAAVIEEIFVEGAGVTGDPFLGGTGMVRFSDAAIGGNLPGGDPIGFDTDYNFAASNPGPRWGIGYHNQDRTAVQIGRFTLTTPTGDVSDLRIGVHVIGYKNGGSESFVTSTTTPVPEPSAALTFAAGMLVASRGLRRR